MRKTLIAAAVFMLTIWSPASAQAWGFVGHRLIMERAIALLPPALKPFFEHYQTELVVRVVDPDIWRNVGWEDDPNHFLDFGIAEFGAYPFDALPRDYSAALEKFGAATLRRNGLLPWREMEMYGQLRRAFAAFTRDGQYATTDAVLFTAVASHYVQDGHQPFHATINYDGQQTGQSGLHSRFERDLIERYQSRLVLTPAAPVHIASIRDFMFDALKAGYQLTEPVLKADKEASAGRENYDDAYYEAFFAKVKPILEQRLSESIAATASVIISAWEDAGRPTLRTEDLRPVQRVRPAR